MKLDQSLLAGYFDRYLKGESVFVLSSELGVREDAVRKALRREAANRGYNESLRLDEIRKSKLRKSRKSEYDASRSAFGVCRFCGVSLRRHRRCMACEVLLHGVNAEYTCGCGIQHGVDGGNGLCAGCEVGYWVMCRV